MLGARVQVRRGRPEHDHERKIVAPFYSGMGATVNCTSARNAAVGITLGIPDLIVHWETVGMTLNHETKVGSRRQTLEQHEYMQRAAACATPYVLGDITSAYDFVCWLGIATRLPETVHFKPRESWRAIVRGMAYHAGESLGRRWAESAEHRKHLERWGYRSGR